MVNNKMRCHFSIVFENVWKLFSILFIMLLSQIDEIINGINGSNLVDSKNVLIGFGIFVLVFLIILFYNIIIWSKTYIWVEDNTIIVERNTLNSRKNTYGIKNISNINIEQNLFERIVGTNLLKIDTNSAAASKSADIKIVFSKEKAKAFKNQVMSYMDNPSETEFMENENNEDFDIVCSTKDVLLHSFYTTPIFSLLIFIGSIVVFIVLSVIVDSDSFLEFITMTVGGVTALFLTVISSIVSLTKSFFNFYDFKAKRYNDMIYLSYGLLKKKKYAIPINKINAVKIVQPTFSRIFKKVHVEIINVGVGDEKNESAGLIISCSREQLKQHMAILLPEFRLAVEEQIKGQSPLYFMHKALGILISAVILLGASMIVSYFLPWVPAFISYSVATALFVLLLISTILSFLTKGFHADEEYIAVANGIFTKTVTILNYNKIQYLVIKQSPISKITGLCKGTIFILANMINQSIVLPYCKEEVFATVGEKIILE